MAVLRPLWRSSLWRLSASTCTLAAQRAATKLGFLVRSFKRPPPLRSQPSSEKVVSTEVRYPFPEIQRPRRHVLPVAVSPSQHARASESSAQSRPSEVKTWDLATDVVLDAPPRTRPRLPPKVWDEAKLRLRIEARGAYGTLPQPVAAGMRVVAAERGRRIRVELGASLDYAGNFTISGGMRAYHPYRITARVSLCRDIVVLRVDLHFCGGVDGGLIVVRSTDTSAKAWIVHLHVSPGLTWWFDPRVGLWAGLSTGPALARPNFFVGPNPGKLAHATQATPRGFFEAGLGLEIRFSLAEEHPQVVQAG